MQNKPVVSVTPERLRHDFLELGFDIIDRLSGSKAAPVADPEDMRVDREGLLTERCVENHVGGLPADAGQGFQILAGPWNLAPEAVDQRPA